MGSIFSSNSSRDRDLTASNVQSNEKQRNISTSASTSRLNIGRRMLAARISPKQVKASDRVSDEHNNPNFDTGSSNGSIIGSSNGMNEEHPSHNQKKKKYLETFQLQPINSSREIVIETPSKLMNRYHVDRFFKEPKRSNSVELFLDEDGKVSKCYDIHPENYFDHDHENSQANWSNKPKQSLQINSSKKKSMSTNSLYNTESNRKSFKGFNDSTKDKISNLNSNLNSNSNLNLNSSFHFSSGGMSSILPTNSDECEILAMSPIKRSRKNTPSNLMRAISHIQEADEGHQADNSGIENILTEFDATISSPTVEIHQQNNQIHMENNYSSKSMGQIKKNIELKPLVHPIRAQVNNFSLPKKPVHLPAIQSPTSVAATVSPTHVDAYVSSPCNTIASSKTIDSTNLNPSYLSRNYDTMNYSSSKYRSNSNKFQLNDRSKNSMNRDKSFMVVEDFDIMKETKKSYRIK